MAKSVIDAVLDEALNYIATNGTEIHLCAGEPANWSEIATKSLLSYTLTAGAGNGDYTITDGVGGDGRRLQVGTGVNSVVASAGGTADHLAITNGVDTVIFVTDVTAKVVVQGNNVDIGSWFIVMPSPTPVV